MNQGNTCNRAGDGNRQRPGALFWLMGIGLLAAGSVAWSAEGLQVDSDGLLSRARDGAPARLELRISNRSGDALRQVYWHASHGQSIACATRTDLGHAFEAGGELVAGDGVECVVPAATPGRSLSAMVAVTATAADGTAQVRYGSLSQRTPRAALNQGALVVLGAAVHADGNGNGLLEAGETIDYHYTVHNAGTLALDNFALTDLAGTVTCPQSALAVAASLVCTRSHTITAAEQTDGLVVNPVDATATDPTSQPVTGSDVLVSINLAGGAGMRVFKSPVLQDDVDADGRASVGDLIRYTFLVKNSNAQALSGLALVEPDPTRIDTPISCTPATLGGQAFALGGGLVSTDTAFCTADYTVRADDQALGQASNLVEAQATAAIAGPITASAASTVVIPADPQIQVSKSVDVSQARPGQTVVYTVTVANVGTVDAGNVAISDPLPTGIDDFAWTCAASGGASCPAASGSGAIDQTVALFPAGGKLVYTVDARIATDAPSTVINQVTATPASNTVCMPAASAGPCQADVPVAVAEPYVEPLPVPVRSRWTLVVLAVGIALVVARRKGGIGGI